MFRKLIILIVFSSFCLNVYAQEKFVRPDSWNSIKHVVVVVLENQPARIAKAQPYMQSLTTKGAYLSNLFAITHPSQPNYIALVAGSNLGVTTNNNVTLDALHVGDLFDSRNLTWKAYAENLPATGCFLGTTNGDYARRHEPFISFRTVQANPLQCAKIVPGTKFFTDLAENKLPSFSLYIPNNRNNGHDTTVQFADNWLKNTFGPVLNNATVLADTLFIITFDEDDDSGNNNIYGAFVGAGVKVGAVSNVRYTLYSVLRLIEDIFELGSLCQNDSTAPQINDIWLP